MSDSEIVLNSLIEKLKKNANLENLQRLKIQYLGRNGVINKLLKKIKNIAPEEKKKYGQTINQLKTSINQLIETKEQQLKNYAIKESFVDETLPGKAYPKGSLHLVSYAIEEISLIFQRLNFIRLSYPEVEWEYYSFDSLNMPKGHPSRDDFETLFVDALSDKSYGKMLLSPHTSSCQVREMLRTGAPPIRMINIAKCYRPNWDQTHTPMFYQFESLCIDKNINIANLKGTIDFFVKQYFGEKRQARLRPHHFQFTEPSFEVDITCGSCLGDFSTSRRSDGVKCRVCKSGWLELAGAGMVHPNVLKAGKIDPKKYTGWAFAFGIERLLMVREGLDNIRLLYNGDIRFLEQF